MGRRVARQTSGEVWAGRLSGEDGGGRSGVFLAAVHRLRGGILLCSTYRKARTASLWTGVSCLVSTLLPGGALGALCLAQFLFFFFYVTRLYRSHLQTAAQTETPPCAPAQTFPRHLRDIGTDTTATAPPPLHFLALPVSSPSAPTTDAPPSQGCHTHPPPLLFLIVPKQRPQRLQQRDGHAKQ